MKPLLRTVVGICLLLATHAHPENIEEVKELPQSKEPIVEAEESEPQARVERCSTCAGTVDFGFAKSPKEIVAALQSLPPGEVHTRQSFEGCSTSKGCAGIKLQDGRVTQKFGNINAFGGDNAFKAASAFGSSALSGKAGAEPFWWMGSNSPFKNVNSASYTSKSSSYSSSGAATGGFGGVDISKNAFLNPGSLSGQTSFESSSYESNKELDLAGNPFLNGNINLGQGFQGGKGVAAGPNVNALASGFGSSSLAGSTADSAGVGYVGSSPAPFATTGSNVNLVQTAQKDFNYGQTQQTIGDDIFAGSTNGQGLAGGELQQGCAGQGVACVLKAQCIGGAVSAATVPLARIQKQYCNTITETCCRLEAGVASSTAGIGFDVESQGSGVISNTAQYDASQSTLGFGSTVPVGPALPVVPVVPAVTAVPIGSTGSFGGVSSASGFGAGYGSTVRPVTGLEPDVFSSQSENNNVYRPGSNGGLKPGVPYLPPVDNSNSDTNIVSSTAFPSTFVTTPRPILTPRPVSSPRPVITPRPVTTPRPFSPARPTYLPPISSTSAPGYLPPVGEQTINRETFVPSPGYSEGEIILDESRLPSTTRQPFVPVISEIPAGCAAALKCTPIEFCTSDGIISNTTVVLTREQDAFRVPLTDCKDVETGRIGKCCRDPFYTDPWPTNQLGQWAEGRFGNDGKYVPDSRGSGSTQQVTGTPFITGSTILNNFRNERPTKPTFTTQGGQTGIIKTVGVGQFGQGGIGQVTQTGIGQYGQQGVGKVGVGQVGQKGIGQIGKVGVGQRGQVGVGQIGQVGVGQTGQVGVGQRGQVGVGQIGQIGVGQRGQFGVGQRGQGGIGQTGQVGVGQRGQVGVGQVGQFGVGQVGQIGVGQRGQIGVGQRGQVGVGQTSQVGVGQFGVGQRGQVGVGQVGQVGVGQRGEVGVGQRGQVGVGQIGQFGVGQRGESEVGQIGQFGVGQRGEVGVGQTGQVGVGLTGQAGVGQTGQFGVGQTGQVGLGQTGQVGVGQFGVGQRGQFGVGQTGQVGVGQTGQVGVGQTGQVGVGQLGQVGVGQLGQVGVGQRGQVGVGQVGQVGVGQKAQVGVGQTGQFGVGQRGEAGIGQIGQFGVGQRGELGVGQRGEAGVGQIGEVGVGQYGQVGVGERGQVGVGQVGQVGVGQRGQVGVGLIGQTGSGQIGQTGAGAFVGQGQGQIGVQEGGFGIGRGQGAIVNQGTGELISFGVGQRKNLGQVSQGITQVEKGQVQYTVEGEGQTITQGGGSGIKKGVGIVENESSASTHRIFLQRYDGSGQCGIQHPQKPYGNRGNQEVDFAEIPWQAMVLLQTNKSLLCGGVITRPDVVITSAACVDGLEAKNVLIKGGEWKLGIDEEPLPFQIVQVKTIVFHPAYKSGSLIDDVAILHLTENLRLANNIQPICLPDSKESIEAFYGGAGECIVTGWGKIVLQAHLLGSIMHGVNMSLIEPEQCESRLRQDYPSLLENYDQESCACGVPSNPLSNVCRVDIGSALACTTGDGHFVLQGIYSWDSGCDNQQATSQLAGFYKFDIEWYEWAIGLTESVRFEQYARGTKITTTKYTGQVTGQGQIGVGQIGTSSIFGQGQVGKGQIITTGQGQIGTSSIYGQGQVGKGQIITTGQGQIGKFGVGQIGTSSIFGQGQIEKGSVITTGEDQLGTGEQQSGDGQIDGSSIFGKGTNIGQIGSSSIFGKGQTGAGQIDSNSIFGKGQFGTGQIGTSSILGQGQVGKGQIITTGQGQIGTSSIFGQGQVGKGQIITTGQGQIGKFGVGQIGTSSIFGQGQVEKGSAITTGEDQIGTGEQQNGDGQIDASSIFGKGTGIGQIGSSSIFGKGQIGTGQIGSNAIFGKGQFGTGQIGTSSIFGQGQIGKGQTITTGEGQIGSIFGQGQITSTNYSQVIGTGSLDKFTKLSEGGLNLGSDIKGPISNTFSATYTEKKFFQTEPKFVTYTTKPEIITYTTKPEIVTFTTKPEIVTFTTKPEIYTYTTKPKFITYTTKPKIITYTTKPKFITYTTKPQIIAYETSGSGTNPQYAAPSVTFNPSFPEVVSHHHSAQCKCAAGKK